MKQKQLTLSGADMSKNGANRPLLFAGYQLLVLAALFLLFPRLRRPGFWVVGGFLVLCPLALRWYLRPHCIFTDQFVSIRRGKRTIRSFRLDALTAIGRCERSDAALTLFLCAVSRKELRRFAYEHEQDCVKIAKNYGFSTQGTENEQLRIALTAYLWRKGTVLNQGIYRIALTEKAWKKLLEFCAERRIELQELAIP